MRETTEVERARLGHGRRVLVLMLAGVLATAAGAAAQQAFEVSPTPVVAVREVVDAGTGARWLLVRDPAHPSGPGRWIRAEAGTRKTERAKGTPRTRGAAEAGSVMELGAVKPPPAILIRGGDPVIVEQQTPVLTARLAAVALEPTTAGRLFEVRLKATGARVWAIALGPGEAKLAPPGVAGR